uniref:NADH-ubiquinone oxidoreductase chain 3 n=1 Tax=Physunio superbus TaxID=2494254 RepID=A0A8A3WIQ3_9BIVA|nr:NADH dehydrogenase subunit 3 [Physunio superbus]
MGVVILTMCVSLLLGLVMSGLSMFVMYRYLVAREVSSPFECGFDPVGSSRVGFSLRFFALMVSFVLFDFETVLFLPLAYLLYTGSVGQTSVVACFMFVLSLFMGVMYEMKEGALEWVM